MGDAAPLQRTVGWAGVFALSLLTACGPVPVDRAERECLKDARLAEAPRGNVWIGGNSAGQTRMGGEITITSDFLLGRDPSQVFDACVMRRSGQRPSRPLIDQPKSLG
jgi:hypothetical protein